MIEAELHGKGVAELEGSEDLLTSAVLGLLQYVPVHPFWYELLKRAKSLDGEPFTLRCRNLGADLAACDSLSLHFWHRTTNYGEPDVVALATSSGTPLVGFIIEVKLWAAKSGEGEEDQLNKYLSALDDDGWLSQAPGGIPHTVRPGLIYLTPRSARDEMQASVKCAHDRERAKRSLFLLQWQDVYEVAHSPEIPVQRPPFSEILKKVALLLNKRGLVYFDGFEEPELDTEGMPGCAHFYYSCRRFHGFTELLSAEPHQYEASFYSGGQK